MSDDVIWENHTELSNYVIVTSKTLCSLHGAWKRMRPVTVKFVIGRKKQHLAGCFFLTNHKQI